MKKEILDELKQIAPSLVSLDRTNPFLVPNGYFADLVNNVLPEEIEINAPKGYFDTLPSVVMHQINKEAKVFSLKSIVTIAAMFIIGMLGIWSLIIDTNASTDVVFTSEMDASELDILNGVFDRLILNDEYEIADLLDLVDDESIDEIIFDTDTEITEDSYIDDLFDGLDTDQLEELL